MTLIDRYVLRLFLRVLGWSLLAFTAIFLLVDLFDHLDNFLDDNASTVSILKYYMYQLPTVVDLVFPVSMLLASLFTLGVLSKNNEFTAILSAGVSLSRLARTVLIFALLMSGADLAFRESVVPAGARRQNEVKQYEIEGRVRDQLKGKSNFTYVGQKGRVYVIRRFRPHPPTLEGLSVQTFRDSTLVERIDAEKAVWKEDHWELVNGTVRHFENGRERVDQFSERSLDPPVEQPLDFSRRTVDPDEMNYAELSRFADWVSRTGGDPTPYEAALANKVSYPLVNFILVVLGLALGSGRRKTTLWAGFGLTVGLAFVYYLLMNFGLQLGKTGAIPIWASAWSGNILYGVAGLILFVRANR
jgi:lipopolysaccharide export system permease protein